MQLKKSLHIAPQKTKQSFVEETPKPAGRVFRVKLGSHFFMRWALLGWDKFKEERGEHTEPHRAEEVPRLEVVWRPEE